MTNFKNFKENYFFITPPHAALQHLFFLYVIFVIKYILSIVFSIIFIKKIYEVTILFLQRRKYKRRMRTEASVLSTRTVKRRLASTLGMEKPKVPLLVPTMKNNTSVPEKSALINARYSAGIPQVSLFGNNLGLDYSPPG